MSQIDSVHDLLRHPRCRELIAHAMSKAKTPESAEEFLEFTRFQTRLGGAVGRKVAEDLGLQSQTTDAMALSRPYGYVLLGLLCGLARQGISLTHLEEHVKGEDCLLAAAVPSSPLSWNGELSAHVSGKGSAYSIDATVTFKGQKFAWGRGKRILKKLFQDIERDVVRFDAESL